jgi:thiamine-monophosphate kinase
VDLSELGEFGFIETLRGWAPNVDTGDDAAIVTLGGQTFALTTDALVEGIHFRRDWSEPLDIGWKAVSVNVSDLAASGARPCWILLALAVPPETGAEFLQGIYRGVSEACDSYGCVLVGGDTVRADEVVIAITAMGVVEGSPLRRRGAEVGDVVAVTGPLGRAATGVNLLLSGDPKWVLPEDALPCIDAHRRPIARVAEGIRLGAAGAHAAIDLSDGLASDVHRLAEACGHGVELFDIPIADEVLRIADARGWDAEAIALTGGEDFELLVTGPESVLGELIPIGRIVDDGVYIVRDDKRENLPASGFDHFSGR